MMRSTLTTPDQRRWRWLLLLLPSGIAAAQLGLLLRTGPGAGNFLIINLLVWFCAGLIWFERLELTLFPQWSSFAWLGLFPLLWSLLVITRSTTIYDPLLNAVPFATLLGLALLLVSGLRRSLVALGLLPLLHYAIINLAPTAVLSKLTADLAAFLLWLANVQVLARGDYLFLAQRTLVVGAGCTGLNVISLSLASVVALLVLNGLMSWWRLLLLAIIAPVTAFFVNGVRVAILCLTPLAPAAGPLAQSTSFTFWHTGSGSMLFALVVVLLLFLIEHLLRGSAWR